MRSHIIRRNISIFFSGTPAIIKFAHKSEHCLCSFKFIIFRNITNGVSSPAVYRQINRLSNRYIFQYFFIITKI